MLCLPTTTTQCRISVRFLQNRPHASSPRAPCSQYPPDRNRRLDDHPPWRLAPCYSLLPYPPSLSSRPPCQRSPSSQPTAALLFKERAEKQKTHEPRHRDGPPMRSPPTTPFRPMSFLGAMLIPAKQRRWVPNSPSILDARSSSLSYRTPDCQTVIAEAQRFRWQLLSSSATIQQSL